jgi:hypothetical protein
VTFDEGERWLVVHRGGAGPDAGAVAGAGGRGIAVAVNLADVPREVAVAGPVLLASDAGVSPAAGGLRLPPDSVAVVEVAGPPLDG